ncbi:uncharacterized protein ACB058_006690 [Synchiropus picturatus]
MSSAEEMTSGQLLQQMALLRWLSSQSEADRHVLTALTGFQVAQQLWNRLTGQNQVDEYKRECILRIVHFLQQNPRASTAAINAEVERHVSEFAARVGALEAAPLF